VGSKKPGIQPDTKGPRMPQAPEAKRQAEEMIGKLDAFLDELAVGHRFAMEETVRWLTGTGTLEQEISASVRALNPLLQKWSIEICFLLRMRERLRFNELKDQLPGIGSRTLSQRLKELESQGIVQRTVFAEVPVRVEYRLTPKGLRMGDLFLPIIAHLRISGWREGMAARSARAPAAGAATLQAPPPPT
jgi:DNA-binding HxlR family transcriptional regulator